MYLPKDMRNNFLLTLFWGKKKVLQFLLAMPNPRVCIAKSNLEGGHWSVLMSFMQLPPPSHARASWSGLFFRFDAVHVPPIPLDYKHKPEGLLWCPDIVSTSSNSLMCRSEPEVSFYHIATPFACPPPPFHNEGPILALYYSQCTTY